LTGRSVTWVQGCDIPTWERADRVSRNTRLTVDHIMASASLPMFFPAVRLDDGWYGDGAVRMVAPLAPAVHMGAGKILTISTRHQRPKPITCALNPPHPPPLQIAGQLLNAVFLDVLDQDAMRLSRLNRLLDRLPDHEHDGLRPVNLMIVRPSQDLSALAGEFEPRLPGLFRHLTRGLGSNATQTPDVLSFLMFQPEYLRRLMEVGEEDADTHAEEIRLFLEH
jgi:NTE family protein